jgi:hypothetical protein
MGRFGTALIITLALGGATLEGYSARAQSSEPAGPVATTPPTPEARLGSPSGTPVGMLLADAGAPDGQEAPPPPPPPGGPASWVGPGGPGMGPGGMRPPMHGLIQRIHHEIVTWSLIYPRHDKRLSVADVQVLAQAILLSKGNHDWKVTDVASQADGSIAFAYATSDGAVIARFAIDPHSGRINRIG